MSKELILIVDDEEDILELVSYNLKKDGYAVASLLSGEEAISFATKKHPSLIVLDLMLPGIDGFEVIRALKGERKTSDIPVIILSAKGEDADIVAGLELGADDYITKPFSPRVLTARVKMIMRRKKKDQGAASAFISVHGIEIDPERHQVTVAGKPVELTATEFALIRFMAGRPGWVFTRNQLIDAVHGEDRAVTDRSVDVQVAGLRKKLGKLGPIIETVHGIGYRFKER